jgi:methyltransferase-like protein/SAM-dependent methyltransferase
MVTKASKGAEKQPVKTPAKAPAKAATRTTAKARAEVPAKTVAASSPAQAEVPASVKAPVATQEAKAPIDRIAKAYDELPYASKPFAQSTPEQLAIMSRLFKLDAPDIATARVLELGCSAGGNIIPLAVRYPKLRAVGIDFSNVEIEQGKIQLVKLGIVNCTLQCLDIAKAADKIEGQFDYIICHGVFSWVPEHVRQAILRLISERMSPNGVAYISYNVYPGWKMREVIRDMMMFHAGGLADPAQQLAQAKAILEYTKGITGETSTYGKMLRDEAGIMSKVSDDYLMHEHLSQENKPMYFREFVQMAADHKLSYLGEAQLGDMAPQRLGADVFNTLSTLSAGNILATEQYMDFFTNRVFRQTLLVHQDVVAGIDRGMKPQLLEGFWFSSVLRTDPKFDAASAPGVLSQYVDAGGRTLTVRGALPHALLARLFQAKPYPVGMDELLAACRNEPAVAGMSDEAIRAGLATELLNLLLQNMVRLHLEPVALPRQMEKPQAYALARIQAESGQMWATNLLHQSVGLSAGHRAALALMNGKRSHAELQAALLEQFKDGRLSAMRGKDRITDEGELNQLAQTFLTQALTELAQLAVLV